MDTVTATIKSEVELAWSHQGRVAELIMLPCERACMTPGLISDLNAATGILDNSKAEIVIVRSKSKTVFSYGGDLDYFCTLIETCNREKLLEYGTACIDLVYWAMTGGRRKLTTVAMVSGHALGGGFEAALACQFIIAEHNALFGLPEVLFGLFPGMGAYPMLVCDAGERFAEQACVSGNQFSAAELYQLGIVQQVVTTAKLQTAVRNFVQSRLRSWRCTAAIDEMKTASPRVSYKQLQQNLELWVNAAMTLEYRERQKMQRIVRKQGAYS